MNKSDRRLNLHYYQDGGKCPNCEGELVEETTVPATMTTTELSSSDFTRVREMCTDCGFVCIRK